RAIDLYAELVAESPGNTFVRHELARSYLDLGDRLHADRKLPEAEAAYRQALAGFVKLVAEVNRETERWGLGRTYQQLGMLQKETGRLKDADQQLRLALIVWNKSVAEFNKHEHRRGWLETHRALVDVLLALATDAEQDETLAPAERQAAAKTFREEAEE